MGNNSAIIGLHLGAGGGACIGNFDTLADLQQGVHGYIECQEVKVPGYVASDGRDAYVSMYINEDGKMLKPPNDTATALFRLTYYPESHDGPMDYICGDVVFTGMPDSEGNNTSLPVEACNAILARLAETRR